jgi:hypothetical protein
VVKSEISTIVTKSTVTIWKIPSRKEDKFGNVHDDPKNKLSALDGEERPASRFGCFIAVNEPPYPLGRKLGGSNSQSGCCVEKRNLLLFPRF